MKAANLKISYRRLQQRFPGIEILHLKIFFRDSFALLETPQSGDDSFSEHFLSFLDVPIEFCQLVTALNGRVSRHYFKINQNGSDFALIDVELSECTLQCYRLEFYHVRNAGNRCFLAVREENVWYCYFLDSVETIMLWDRRLSFSILSLDFGSFIHARYFEQRQQAIESELPNGMLFKLELSWRECSDALISTMNVDRIDVLHESDCQDGDSGVAECICVATDLQQPETVQSALARFESAYTAYAVLQMQQNLDGRFLVVAHRPVSLDGIFRGEDAKQIECVYTADTRNRIITVFAEKGATLYDPAELDAEMRFYALGSHEQYDIVVKLADVYAELARARPCMQLGHGWVLWFTDLYFAKLFRIRLDLVKPALCRAELRRQLDEAHKQIRDAGENEVQEQLEKQSQETPPPIGFRLLPQQKTPEFGKFKANAARKLLALEECYRAAEQAALEHTRLLERIGAIKADIGRFARECARTQEKMNAIEAQRILELRRRRINNETVVLPKLSIMDPQRAEMEEAQCQQEFEALKEDSELRAAMRKHLQTQHQEEIVDKLDAMREKAEQEAQKQALCKQQLKARLEQLAIQRESARIARADRAQRQKTESAPPCASIKMALISRK